MINKGNIVKISSGTLKETSAQDYTAFAKNIQTNAGKKILENSNDGVVYGEPAKMTVKEDPVNITVGLFFDGTGNNRQNITERETPGSTIYKDKTTGWKWKWQDNTSYENDRTNVDNLEKMYKKQALYFSIYIEGIGTTDKAYDNVPDMGTGMGSTGIRGKVRRACEVLVQEIRKRSTTDIGVLTIDVFGFSRGAAAARNFAHEVTKAAYKARVVSNRAGVMMFDEDDKVVEKSELPARGHFGLKLEGKMKVNTIRLRFAGLFDTVSAYGIVHKDDLKQLNLNAINKASSIVHLTAADEHREKFELTSVSTGIELSLPGVHSDVGGSYRDNVMEEVSLAEEMLSVINRTKLINDERNKLIEQGWYRANQMTNNQPYKLIGKRKLSNKYSLIPLHLMFELGKDICKFEPDQLQSKFKIPAAPLPNSNLSLTDVYKRLRDFAILKTAPPLLFNTARQLQSIKNMVNAGVYPAAKYNETVKDHIMLYELRNRYLHFSSSWDGIGKEPEINEKGERERVVFNKRTT